jgi:protein involved in polysaccharide export with SLBB domain
VNKVLSDFHCRKNMPVYTLTLCLLFLAGCGGPVSSGEQLRNFEKAGPFTSDSETDSSILMKYHVGPYRVIPGDVLELQMPAVFRILSSEFSEWLKPVYGRKDYEPYLVRVGDNGTIMLPIVGEITAAGHTLSEIEASILDAYYPKYIVNPPTVVCEVVKYQKESERVFAVLGLVNNPDAFPYPPDTQYNLMEALAFAGGLDMTADPRYVRVYRQNIDGTVVSATFGVDSKSVMGAYAVAIKPGDVIYVDHTLRTRVNQFLSNVLQIRVGADIRRNGVD